MMIDDLKKYGTLTYYEESRKADGKLSFCSWNNFDKVEFDHITNVIVLSSKKNPMSRCIIDPALKYEIIHINREMDRIEIFNKNWVQKFFCKKN